MDGLFCFQTLSTSELNQRDTDHWITEKLYYFISSWGATGEGAWHDCSKKLVR